MSGLKVLFVGQMVPGARTHQRVAAFQRLGCDVTLVETNAPGGAYEDSPSLVDRIRYRVRRPADKGFANSAIQSLASASDFHLAWFERAVEIKAATLKKLKLALPDIKLVWYAEDDMMNPLHRSAYVEESIPLYDLWVTTKSFNAGPREIPTFGVKQILFVHNSYDPILHQPPTDVAKATRRWENDVSFIGTYEKPRAESLLHLADNGVAVRVWGNGWGKMQGVHSNLKIENKPVYDRDYVQAVSQSKINLCFLRKGNRDLQTCRSIEIPAMGGFMMHERNAEICGLLPEDTHAVYFQNDGELLQKVREWLPQDDARALVASQGHDTITKGNFRHEDRLQDVLNAISGEAV